MWYTFSCVRLHNRYKLKREKKPINLKHIIACVGYNIKNLFYV